MMKLLLGALLMCSLFGCAEREKAEIVLKNCYIFEHYAPMVYKESEYLLVDMADRIASDARLENGDWHFSIDVKDRGGEIFYMEDMLVYLQPGNKLNVECNMRMRHESVFEGETGRVNKWLNQRLLRGNSLLYAPSFSKEYISLNDYCSRIDRVADSLQADMKNLDVNQKFVRNMERRLNFMRVDAYCRYVERMIDMQRYGGKFDTPETFEAWKKEELAKVVPVIVEKAFSLLRGYKENEIVAFINGQKALIALENLQEGSLKELQFKRFEELYDYARTKLYDSNFKYSAGIAAYAQQLSDPRLREAMMKLVEDNRDIAEGADMRDFEFEDAEGKKHRLSEYKGKVMYIDVWATWCNPCKAISPNFEELAKEYEGKNIQFVAISIDKKVETWRKYMEQHGVHDNLEEWVCTDKAFIDTYRITSIPRFLLIDKHFKARMTYAHKPIEASMGELKTLLNELIAE